MSTLKAVRAFCLECCGGSYKEVKLCPAQRCPLYAYRLGHRPKKPGENDRNSLEGVEGSNYTESAVETLRGEKSAAKSGTRNEGEGED